MFSEALNTSSCWNSPDVCDNLVSSAQPRSFVLTQVCRKRDAPQAGKAIVVTVEYKAREIEVQLVCFPLLCFRRVFFCFGLFFLRRRAPGGEQAVRWHVGFIPASAKPDSVLQALMLTETETSRYPPLEVVRLMWSIAEMSVRERWCLKCPWEWSCCSRWAMWEGCMSRGESHNIAFYKQVGVKRPWGCQTHLNSEAVGSLTILT